MAQSSNPILTKRVYEICLDVSIADIGAETLGLLLCDCICGCFGRNGGAAVH